MYDGDEYEDQLLGDPNQLDDLIEARDVNPLEDEQNGGEENEADGQDQEKDDEPSTKKKQKKVLLNPQPKLDAVRLTGPRGIATIEGLFRDFKFLGHGYEEQDLKRIMEQLELWGNRLFPKYQFDDLLDKVEKLGQKPPVMNFVKKIRMGIVTEDSVAEDSRDIMNDVEMDLDADLVKETEGNAVASDDLFTQLIEQQLSQMESQKQWNSAPAPVPQPTISEEQRQRMLQNRRLAEERSLARLKAQQEKDSAPSTIGESSQADISLKNSKPSMLTVTVDQACPVSPSDEAEQNSISEKTDGNVDIKDTVVSTIDEQNSEGIEIIPNEVGEGDEQNSKGIEIIPNEVGEGDEQNSEGIEIMPNEVGEGD